MFAHCKNIQSHLVHQFYFFHQVAHALVRRNRLPRCRIGRSFYKSAYPNFHIFIILLSLQMVHYITKCMVKLFTCLIFMP